MGRPGRRVPVRWLDRTAYDQLPPDERLRAARVIPDRFRSSHDMAVARFRDMAATIRKERPVTDLKTPVLAVEVAITTAGATLREQVQLTVEDFAEVDLQAAAFWEEADPETYKQFTDGDLSLSDFAGSALRMRAFLYAFVRAKLSDSRLRAEMALTDLSVSMPALMQLAAALEDLPDDLSEQLSS